MVLNYIKEILFVIHLKIYMALPYHCVVNTHVRSTISYNTDRKWNDGNGHVFLSLS